MIRSARAAVGIGAAGLALTIFAGIFVCVEW